MGRPPPHPGVLLSVYVKLFPAVPLDRFMVFMVAAQNEPLRLPHNVCI